MATSQIGCGRHVVIRNTFLEFSDDSTTLERNDPLEPRRVRSFSDMTDSKMPVKVELANSAGFYQFSRHRLSSTLAGDGQISMKNMDSPTGAEQRSLPPVMEESDMEARFADSGSKADRSPFSTKNHQVPFPNGLGGSIGCMTNLGVMPPPLPLSPQWCAMFGNMNSFRIPPPPGILSGHTAPAQQAPTFGDYRPVARSAGIDTYPSQVTEQGGNRLQLAELLPETRDNAVQKELTTVMMRNIPTHYTRSMLLELLDSNGFHGQYDFVYLPMDFRNGVNLAYAFVNMTSHRDALLLTRALHGYSEWLSEDCKGCDVSWAHPNQGLQEHVERYRNSPVMHPNTPDAFKPMVFKNGKRVPFPAPTKQIKAPKLKHATNGRPKSHEDLAKGQEVVHEPQ
eukprot:CAMPEP_0169238794 /NCGR_PEP_ID=MMETSP1016-20121227/30545_1 /TAXON_ID=342587 /ORGANISM="Karlodinium micrum, Strain CCMP2283" /LENGTH=395 /DNA_ID=CAMNT_0009318639 /DNA_START=20 /DNA_END=1204 /DNA_ORIENTATION=-